MEIEVREKVILGDGTRGSDKRENEERIGDKTLIENDTQAKDEARIEAPRIRCEATVDKARVGGETETGREAWPTEKRRIRKGTLVPEAIKVAKARSNETREEMKARISDDARVEENKERIRYTTRAKDKVRIGVIRETRVFSEESIISEAQVDPSVIHVSSIRRTPCVLSFMNLWPILLLCLTHVHQAYSIQCYECVHNNQRVRRHDRYVYPCAEFDRSQRYIMNCPDSSFCVYQTVTLTLARERVSVMTMEGCTPNSTARGRNVEASLVQPGCLTHRNAYRPPSSQYCYCDYNFCNDAITHRPSWFIILGSISLWLYSVFGRS